MYNPRDIIDVYEKINEVIPNEYNEFKKELKDYIDSLWNQAPEVRMSSHTFIPFSNILIKYIPNIIHLSNEDLIWKFNVRDIFNGNLILREENNISYKLKEKND